MTHGKAEKHPPSCWIVVEEGLTGTENQCLGVAQALGVIPEIKRIRLREPWRSLSPWLGFPQGWSFRPPLVPPWPDLLIASGRKSIAASLYVKKKAGDKVFTVQIQDPRIKPEAFDLVALPAHDPTRGGNVVVTTAAPNLITEQRLEAAYHRFSFLMGLPRPRVAVLIGGSTKVFSLTAGVTRELAEKLGAIEGGLMITASRRTGAENALYLREALKEKKTYFWDGKGENPYMGFLAWADVIVVTSDSVSMLSEACTTGKPVYMIALEGQSRRLGAFHKTIVDNGMVRLFEGKIEEWKYAPLDDAGLVAREIRARYLGGAGF